MAKIGIMIEAQDGTNWERWNRLIDACHDLGLDSLWRSDHLFSLMGDPTRPALALVPSLTAVALKSDRLEFGAVVSPMTFRHPVMLAREAVALDQLSNGRYWLGIGAGWNEGEHKAFGFDLMPVGKRMDRMEESLEIITRLWTGDPVSFDGKHFRLENAQMHPTPRENGRVPIMIGGSGEKRTLRMAAQYADEWNATAHDQETYRHKLSVLEGHCRDVGRDPSEIQRSMMGPHVIGRNQDEIMQRVENLRKISPGMGALEPQGVLDRIRGHWGMAGTPDEIIEQIRSWEKLGMQRFMFQTLDQDDLDVVEIIAREIAPHVAS